MKIRSRIGEAFRMYFILFTLISILLMILGFAVDSDRTFGYEVFLSPLIYAAIAVIPVFFFETDREVSIKTVIIRRIIQLITIEAAVMVLAINSDNIDTGRLSVVIGIAVGIVIVFILSMIVEYACELSVSRELNTALLSYQKDNDDKTSEYI
jgi:hypothetical protein